MDTLTPESLVGNIGGSWGVFLGASLISFLEVPTSTTHLSPHPNCAPDYHSPGSLLQTPNPQAAGLPRDKVKRVL